MTGILFDLDGTLLNTLEDIASATNHVLAQLGCPTKTREEIRRAVGNGAGMLLRKTLPEGTGEEKVQQALELFQSHYTAHCQIQTKPYEGIPQALEELKKRYPLAIVSNKPDMAVKALCAGYFPGIYAMGEHPGCPRKPAADMVFQAMEAIGVDRCIYVGDSEVDVLTAQNAAVPCLAVLWGFRDRGELEGAAAYCADPGELTKKIEEMIHGQ